MLQKICKNRWFYISIILLIGLAIASRFILLGAKPLHHDEGMLAYFAWKLAMYRDYIYTPQIHGPILFYLAAVLFKVFGQTDAVVRAGCALAGVFIVAIPLLSGNYLNRFQKFAISILFLASPLMLYYSRFLVHTAIEPVFILLLIFNIYAFFARPNQKSLIYSVISLALAFGTSEVTFIYSASLFASGVIAYFIARRWAPKFFKNVAIYFKKNKMDILYGALVFALVYSAIYSIFFTSWTSFKIGLPNPFSSEYGLGFWLAQNPKRLGGQPWYYYIMLFAVYEPVILAGFIGSAIYYLRSKRVFPVFLIIFSLINLAIFSWAGEKFPWLALNSLVPMIVLAGYFAGDMVKARKSVFAKAFLAAMAVLLLYGTFSAYMLSYKNSYDTRELAVYVQTPKKIYDKFMRMREDCGKTANCVLTDADISWPMSYVFRDNGGLYSASGLSVGENVKYLISENISKIDGKINKDEWESESYQLREWWVPTEYPNGYSTQNIVKYLFTRQIWSEKGGYDIMILHKK